MAERQSWAAQIGHLFAYGQHGLDKAIEWGFRSMRTAAGAKRPPAPKKGVVGSAERLGRGVLGFLGDAGAAYYERYEELKKPKA